ncbi:MAG: hypothetical protein Q8Q94_01280 [bacterium]|nr:hypothetical protein [bacterium]MDZ4299382.1 hypothetical protein [Candidatus Sungbacteria bacterium]
MPYSAFALIWEFMEDPSAVILAQSVEEAARLAGGVLGDRVENSWEVRYYRHLFGPASSEEEKALIDEVAGSEEG